VIRMLILFELTGSDGVCLSGHFGCWQWVVPMAGGF
jgi:hypothetical protein